MIEIDISLPPAVDADLVVETVETSCVGVALQITMKSTLKKFPGCVHWHLKRREERGILEVTWWPADNGTRPPRLWLSIHGNRQADWMRDAMPRLRERIETKLSL